MICEFAERSIPIFVVMLAFARAGGLKELNFVGFDIVEVLPAYDPSEIIALLAANIVFGFISIISYNKIRCESLD